MSEPSEPCPPAGRFLSFLMSSTPLRKTIFSQFVLFVVMVLDMTYLVTSFTPGHMASCVGQKEANISNVFLPKRRSADFNCFAMSSSAASPASKYGIAQPPYLKPPDLSSSALPPAWMTPSSVINSKTTIFLIVLVHLVVPLEFLSCPYRSH